MKSWGRVRLDVSMAAGPTGIPAGHRAVILVGVGFPQDGGDVIILCKIDLAF